MARNTTVRMRVSIAGTIDGRPFGYEPGDVLPVPAELAAKWLRAGHCEPVRPAVERAVKPPTENTTRPR